ncbi:MAG: hypothetical protein ACRDMZ_09620 [Solirubrobacteraceae bacterium]
MGHSKAVVPLVLALLCAGCASLPGGLDRPFRKPGQKLADFPAAVSAQYGCDQKKLPWFKLESLEIWPQRLTAGSELGHRMVYVLCTAGPSEVVTGKLETRILHRGAAVFSDAQPNYDLRPGRWIVDVFVKVPAEAGDGLYSLSLDFKSPAVQFTQSEDFAVEAGPK